VSSTGRRSIEARRSSLRRSACRSIPIPRYAALGLRFNR
jgi:hypothetical protein